MKNRTASRNSFSYFSIFIEKMNERISQMREDNDISFVRLRGKADPCWSFFIELYEQSFPWSERRDEYSLLQKIADDDHFFCNALFIDNKFVGLFSFWDFQTFRYIEHFAVLPSLRNEKIGTATLSAFLRESTSVVLEVEHPNDDLSKRRLAFYERLGFQLMCPEYMQPSYHEDEPDLPLLLLQWGSVSNVKDVVSEIYKTVYDR